MVGGYRVLVDSSLNRHLRETLAALPLIPSGVNPPGSKRRKTTRFSPNGKSEVERRIRQIAAGQLKVAVVPASYAQQEIA